MRRRRWEFVESDSRVSFGLRCRQLSLVLSSLHRGRVLLLYTECFVCEGFGESLRESSEMLHSAVC